MNQALLYLLEDLDTIRQLLLHVYCTILQSFSAQFTVVRTSVLVCVCVSVDKEIIQTPQPESDGGVMLPSQTG